VEEQEVEEGRPGGKNGEGRGAKVVEEGGKLW